jgi:hypothetical protein
LALAALAVLALLAAVPLWSRWSRGGFGTAGWHASGPVRVTRFVVERFGDRGEGRAPQAYGALGERAFDAAVGDFVRVSAALSRPAYCFLLALNPDGSIQLCYPPGPTGSPDEAAAPPETDRVDYPALPTRYFSLTDGRGEQAFVLLAAPAPLPPFARWRARLGQAPWTSRARSGGDAGVWGFDDREIQPLRPAAEGARGTEVDRVPASLVDLCSFLKAGAQVATFRGLVFPVR